MRIGMFTYGIEDENKLSGIARYTVELTRALREVEPGLDLVLLTPYPDSTIGWYREFETYPVPTLKRLPAVMTLGHAALGRAARKLELDVLHDPCGVAPFLAPRGPVRRVVTVHDAFARVVPGTQDPLMRLLYRTLVPLARVTADAVITVSRASARDLTASCGIPASRVHVTPLGVHPPAPPSPDDGEVRRALGVTGPYFLFVGNLTPRKNLGRVLSAYARLRGGRPDVGLVVVGPAFWRSSEIFAQARETRGVVLTGFVPDSALGALYRGALGLVFPSLYDGFGLPALEAMAQGCPVITSDVSSLPEVVGDAALLVDPLSEDAILAATRRLLDEPGLAAELRRRGHLRAATFDWRRTARQTLEVYRHLTGEGTGQAVTTLEADDEEDVHATPPRGPV